MIKLKIVYLIPELELTYAEDDIGNRYVIGEGTNITFTPKRGDVFFGIENGKGYLLEAHEHEIM